MSIKKIQTTKKFAGYKKNNCFGIICSTNRALKVYPLHYHDYIEIEYLVSGRLYQEINGIKMICEPGACWCLDRCDLHCFELIEPVIIHNICIDVLSAPSAIVEFLGKTDFPLTGNLDRNSLEIVVGLFERLSDILNNNDRFSKEKCTAYLLLLLSQIFENSSTISGKPDKKGYNYISAAIEYMCENYQKKLSLDAVAKELFISPKYFSRLFKEITGHSFVRYLNYIRVEKAKELLTGTALSVTHIAMDCGFESFPTFSRQFKAICGCSPTRYRKTDISHGR